MTRTQELAYWITEREAMRKAKEAAAVMGAGPGHKHGWSDDLHMGTVRYCNVRREDDKVTKWLAQHWRPQYREVWQILLARLINNVPTLEHLKRRALEHQFTIDPLEEARSELKKLRQEGPIFGNAYTVSTSGVSMDKVDYIIDRVLIPAEHLGIHEDYPWDRPGRQDRVALAEMNLWLQRLTGVSSFMSGQIIADLKNTQGHPLQTAPDWYTWAAPGPGSLRGLEAYFGRRVTPSGFTAALAQVWQEVKPLLSEDLHDLHMQDLQNCMCEFSKYVRVKEGGHARNRYNARDR